MSMTLGQSKRQGPSGGEGAVRPKKPIMDLCEDTSQNVATATFELPGIDKKDVSIEVHHGRLTVAAESKPSLNLDESGYAIRERYYGKFSRTLQLPEDADEDEIKASMSDGILTVSFPAHKAVHAPKKVMVQ